MPLKDNEPLAHHEMLQSTQDILSQDKPLKVFNLFLERTGYIKKRTALLDPLSPSEIEQSFPWLKTVTLPSKLNSDQIEDMYDTAARILFVRLCKDMVSRDSGVKTMAGIQPDYMRFFRTSFQDAWKTSFCKKMCVKKNSSEIDELFHKAFSLDSLDIPQIKGLVGLINQMETEKELKELEPTQVINYIGSQAAMKAISMDGIVIHKAKTYNDFKRNPDRPASLPTSGTFPLVDRRDERTRERLVDSFRANYPMWYRAYLETFEHVTDELSNQSLENSAYKPKIKYTDVYSLLMSQKAFIKLEQLSLLPFGENERKSLYSNGKLDPKIWNIVNNIVSKNSSQLVSYDGIYNYLETQFNSAKTTETKGVASLLAHLDSFDPTIFIYMKEASEMLSQAKKENNHQEIEAEFPPYAYWIFSHWKNQYEALSKISVHNKVETDMMAVLRDIMNDPILTITHSKLSGNEPPQGSELTEAYVTYIYQINKTLIELKKRRMERYLFRN